ncbi:MAG: hypothetical protein O7E57_02705, partial [Gammaproteobacteria bacterium]|nr:hypothetical protein [Gammaproteobacteria bacterium]
MAITDGAGLSITLCTGSASPHETKFVKELIRPVCHRRQTLRTYGTRQSNTGDEPVTNSCLTIFSMQNLDKSLVCIQPNQIA